MATQFPNLCPVRRDYAPGEYATRRFNSISGTGTTRLYGSKPFDATLNIEFSVDDEELEKILESWNKSYGSYDVVALPAQVFVGMSDAVQGQVAASLNWRWAERPTVSSVLPNRSRVQTKFIATLDVA